MSIDDRLRLAGLPALTRQMWLEIDVDALVGNVAAIRARVGLETAIWPVVKADGYGHGLEVAGRAFRAGGAAGLCVATLDEAWALRSADISGPVLILYPVPPEAAEGAARAGFELSVSTVEGAVALASVWQTSGAAHRDAQLRVHLEIETGLTRMGIAPDDAPRVSAMLTLPGLTIAAAWSHLASPEDVRASDGQERRLAAARASMVDRTVVGGHATADGPGSHLAATGGVLTHRGTTASMVRPGLLAYGLMPSTDSPPVPGIRPAMRLVAHPMRIHHAEPGTHVGYGGTWTAPRGSRIATLPVGYGDGYARSLAGGQVLVRGTRAPIVGVVSMDALMVDVTDVPGVALADEFVLLGEQGTDSITVLELARSRTTIPWEVVTAMARRSTRVYDASVGLLGVRTLAGETLVRDRPWS